MFDKNDFRNVVPRFAEENRKANAALVEVLATIKAALARIDGYPPHLQQRVNR